MSGCPHVRLFTMAVMAATTAWSADTQPAVGRRSALPGDKPDGTILRLDIDAENNPNLRQ